jgi:hypothetical protein
MFAGHGVPAKSTRQAIAKLGFKLLAGSHS